MQKGALDEWQGWRNGWKQIETTHQKLLSNIDAVTQLSIV